MLFHISYDFDLRRVQPKFKLRCPKTKNLVPTTIHFIDPAFQRAASRMASLRVALRLSLNSSESSTGHGNGQFDGNKSKKRDSSSKDSSSFNAIKKKKKSSTREFREGVRDVISKNVPLQVALHRRASGEGATKLLLPLRSELVLLMTDNWKHDGYPLLLIRSWFKK